MVVVCHVHFHYMKQLRVITAVVFLSVAAAYLAPPAQAIIILPALILIPIAKIIAIVVGGFAFPALGMGVLWNKLFNTPLKKVLVFAFLLLVVIGVCTAVYLKVTTPERPLF